MVNSNRTIYEQHIRFWSIILKVLIGWSQTQVEQWARRYESDILDESSGFDHEAPEHYAVGALITDALVRDLPGPSLMIFARQIEAVLRRVLEPAPNMDEVDWQPALVEIDNMLRAHGTSLEEVRYEKAKSFRE